MPNIDFSLITTAEQTQAQLDAARALALKAECRDLIFEVIDATAQTNIAAAASAGLLTQEQMDVYRSGVGWINDMRAACKVAIEGGEAKWPDAPSAVSQMAAAF